MYEPRWRCEYFDPTGKRCTETAVYRLQYSLAHPFDHVDVCARHRTEYQHAVKTEVLTDGVSRSE